MSETLEKILNSMHRRAVERAIAEWRMVGGLKALERRSRSEETKDLLRAASLFVQHHVASEAARLPDPWFEVLCEQAPESLRVEAKNYRAAHSEAGRAPARAGGV